MTVFYLDSLLKCKNEMKIEKGMIFISYK